MKKIIFIFSLLTYLNISAQESDMKIIVKNTDIVVPSVYNFDTISEISYAKYTLINKRNTTLEIKDIKTPSGFFVNISQKQIAPNKKVNIYIGITPQFTDFNGSFQKQIIIQTNLIKPIVLKTQGFIMNDNK